MKYFAISCAFLTWCLLAATNIVVAQHTEESIEDSWNRATNENAAQKTPNKAMEQDASREAYKWKKGETATDQPVQQPVQTDGSKWPYLPASASSADLYRANNALIDSLTNMYCVSAAYLRTLRNRNESAKVNAPPPPPADVKKSGDKFDYEKDSWNKDKEAKPKAPPPPAPDTKESELRVLNEELFQLFNKCLNQ